MWKPSEGQDGPFDFPPFLYASKGGPNLRPGEWNNSGTGSHDALMPVCPVPRQNLIRAENGAILSHHSVSREPALDPELLSRARRFS